MLTTITSLTFHTNHPQDRAGARGRSDVGPSRFRSRGLLASAFGSTQPTEPATVPRAAVPVLVGPELGPLAIKKQQVMFDGNHRVRRTQNLGGGGGSRRNRPSSRRTRPAGASSAALLSEAVSSITGIPDRKSQLLEQAKIQREHRREVARQNGAARDVQRLYRGWRCRKSVVVGSLRVRYEELVTGIGTSSAVGGSDGGSSLSGSAAASAPGQSQQQALANMVSELASVLGALLSPSLLPIVARENNKRKEEAVLDLVLPFASIDAKVAAAVAGPTSSSFIFSISSSSQGNNAHAAETMARSSFVCGRIVRRCLVVLQALSSAPKGMEDKVCALVGLVATLLGSNPGGTSSTTPTSTTNDNNDDNGTIMTQVLCNGTSSSAAAASSSAAAASSSAAAEGYGPVLLFLCFRDWFAIATSARKCSLDRSVVVQVTGVLLRLSTRAASLLSSTQQQQREQQQLGTEQDLDAKSILAAALFASHGEGIRNEWSAEIDRLGSSTAFTAQQQEGSGSGYGALLASLVRVLVDNFDGAATPPTSAALGTSPNNYAVRNVVQSMVSGREVTLLTNVLDRLVPRKDGGSASSASIDVSSVTLLVHLVDYVLDKRRDLAVVASLAARGENIRATLLKSSADIIAPTADDDSNGDEAAATLSDSDDDDDGVDKDTPGPQQQQAMQGLSQAASRAGSKRPASSRFSRQDLQTTGKLDRLYHTEIASARREVLLKLKGGSRPADVELLVALAERIGGGPLMSLLGASLFRANAPTTPALQSTKLVYTTVLSFLFQSLTCFKTRNSSVSSPLLSSLSFNTEFLGEMWRFALSASGPGLCTDLNAVASVAAMVTFCDLFSHQLLSLDDDEFLHNYTTVKDAGVAIKAIVAEEVVTHIRRCLYETYWTKPVTRKDVNVPSRIPQDNPEALFSCHRMRLLLSGTKVWNSLHERWCRLYRSTPFCDEQTWWFPKLVTKGRDDDAVMVGGISSAAVAAHDDDDSMSDSESDASPMDVDTSSLDGNGGGEDASQEPTAAEEENDALASTFSDPKMARVLTGIPQALPFDRRVKMFSSLLAVDKARTQDETRAFRQAMMRAMDEDEEWEFTGREQAEIRRDRLYEDSMDQLNKLGRKLRRKVQITMINKHGQQEAGIDGGGVFKEFLDDLIKEAFDPEVTKGGGDDSDSSSARLPLFAVTPTQTLAVNIDAGRNQDTLAHYEFLGRVLGKAVYELILVEPQFCLSFLNQLLGRQNTLDDLKNLDPEYYRHLNGLRKMSAADIAGMGLTFELTRGDQNQTTIELMPGGSSVAVTKQNAIRYVHLVAHRKLNVESAAQTHAFLRGFRDLIPAAWVRLFSANELQKLISGDDTVKGIDVAGLRAAMAYAGGYHPSQPIMQWFWEVLESFTPSQQRDFLKFMTSCSRQPLLGFQALVPVPCIQQIRLQEEEAGNDSSNARLPTSSTCMNLLKLPKYRSKEMLREKLLYAIESGAGFELS